MTDKKQNIIIASSSLFLIVAIMHLLRFIFDMELIIAGTYVPIWASLFAFIITGALALFNLSLVEDKNRIFWLRFFLFLLLFDAFFVFYSWLEKLSYWGITSNYFFYIFLFDMVVIAILMYFIKKGKRKLIV